MRCAIKKLCFLLTFVSILAANSYADDLGYRLGSAISGTDTSIVEFPGGDQHGKIMQFYYDKDFTQNFFLEGALGYRSPDDIFEYSSAMYELSPGVKVAYGALVMKLSIGASYMPENSFDPVTYDGYRQWDFVVHFGIGLKDPTTGVTFMLERTHYSNGYSQDNPSLNYSGFTLSIPAPWN